MKYLLGAAHRAAIGAAAALLLALTACVASYLPDGFGVMTDTAVRLENSRGHGSGTVIAGNLVLTAAHVADVGDLTMVTVDGTKRNATLLWKHEDRDVAVMKFDGEPASVAAPLDCKPIEWGEPIYWIGNPNSLHFNFKKGHVASPVLVEDWENKTLSLAPVAALVNPGDSGSGAFSPDGELRGVIVGIELAQFGMFMSQSGNGLMVPTSEFCVDMMSAISASK